MHITAIGGGPRELAMRAALETLPSEQTSVLIIPTACSNPSSYERKVPLTEVFFNDTLGVPTRRLHEFGEQPSSEKIAHEIGSAALLYTVGGNLPHLLRKLRGWKADTILKDTLRAGKPYSGTSAGALLPFTAIHSNPSARPSKEAWDFDFPKGLAVLGGVATAHADAHDETLTGPRPDSRFDHLIANFPEDSMYGLGIENGTAVIFGDSPQIIKSDPHKQVYLIQCKSGIVSHRAIQEVTDLNYFTEAVK